jgi:RimJ/RimL family protein N-acetyltransferase
LYFKNNELIGCGMVIKTILDWDYCDLGVWVNPKHRGNSFGAQILMKLREFALKSNLKASCGCAIENVASQKTIEKSGFVSRYYLVKFKIT